MLSTLRGASDLLCGLLQLLLSDSAVDWSVDREAHAARKDQDTAVGLRLCASRCVCFEGVSVAGLVPACTKIINKCLTANLCNTQPRQTVTKLMTHVFVLFAVCAYP